MCVCVYTYTYTYCLSIHLSLDTLVASTLLSIASNAATNMGVLISL